MDSKGDIYEAALDEEEEVEEVCVDYLDKLLTLSLLLGSYFSSILESPSKPLLLELLPALL